MTGHGAVEGRRGPTNGDTTGTTAPKHKTKYRTMILGAVSYVDCFVFVLALVPVLLSELGARETLGSLLRVLPFLRESVLVPVTAFPLSGKAIASATAKNIE